MKLEVSEKELIKRRKNVLKEARKMNIEVLCFFDVNQIFYLTNFKFISTERPIALILKSDDMIFFVPKLEEEHVKLYNPGVKVKIYPEYPYSKHPMEHLKLLFEELKLQDKIIGVDSDGAPGLYGYEGPKISEILPDAKIKIVPEIIRKMMMIKSEEEIALIKESAKWAVIAMSYLQRYIKPDISENEVSMKASMDATIDMVNKYGEKDISFTGIAEGIYAGFRGQVGKFSYYPHSLTRNAIIREGDILGTGAGPCIGGYYSELERTYVVGKPDKEQKKYFELMNQVQELALKTIVPGIKCYDVDRKVMRFFRENELMDYWMHHTGHSIGLKGHEPPFLDIGCNTEIKCGMVFTIEPGIYVPNIGGFRHSDTVVVTEDGIEIITAYPSDLESLTIK